MSEKRLECKPIVAVIMSVYWGDSKDYISKCVDSLLRQTYHEFVVYIALDGPVKPDVYRYLEGIDRSRFQILRYEENLGLAFRLNQIIEEVMYKYDYLARMDADDICSDDRLEKQINYMDGNPDVWVLGSDLVEIDENECELFYKRMYSDHDALVKNIIKRCPLNHPTVVFRSSIFWDQKIRYRLVSNTQDYYLWVDIIRRGYRLSNLNEPLLFFRVDNGFHKKRGLGKAFNDFSARIYAMQTLKIWSLKNCVYTLMLFLMRISPSSCRSLAYKYFR